MLVVVSPCVLRVPELLVLIQSSMDSILGAFHPTSLTMTSTQQFRHTRMGMCLPSRGPFDYSPPTCIGTTEGGNASSFGVGTQGEVTVRSSVHARRTRVPRSRDSESARMHTTSIRSRTRLTNLTLG